MKKPDWNNPPIEVMRLTMASTNMKFTIPVSITVYNETIDKYPEYFPEQAEHRRKWKLIPEYVHTACNASRDLKMKEYFGDDGIFSENWESKMTEYEKEEKVLLNKYYNPYGIKY